MAYLTIADFGRTGSVQLACKACGEPLDWVSWPEVVLITARHCGETLCFDCAGRQADQVPSVMLIDGQIADQYIWENERGLIIERLFVER